MFHNVQAIVAMSYRDAWVFLIQRIFFVSGVFPRSCISCSTEEN